MICGGVRNAFAKTDRQKFCTRCRCPVSSEARMATYFDADPASRVRRGAGQHVHQLLPDVAGAPKAPELDEVLVGARRRPGGGATTKQRWAYDIRGVGTPREVNPRNRSPPKALSPSPSLPLPLSLSLSLDRWLDSGGSRLYTPFTVEKEDQRFEQAGLDPRKNRFFDLMAFGL